MAQWVKLLFPMSASNIQALIEVLAVVPVQLPSNKPGKAGKHGAITQIPVLMWDTQMEFQALCLIL